jgi:thiol-disulfide isomerase/thioredoxin
MPTLLEMSPYSDMSPGGGAGAYDMPAGYAGGGGGNASPLSSRQVVAIREEAIGPNNGFAIAVLVISIVAIVVCILIVFLVKPCPRSRGKLQIIVDDEPSAAGAAAAGRGAVDISSEAHLDKVLKGGPVLLMAHAPWCGHCQKAKPEFSAAAAAISKTLPGLKVAMLDGEKVKGALKKLGVGYFPFSAYYENGKQVAEHKGERSKKAYVEFAKKHYKGATGAAAAATPGDAQEIGSMDELASMVSGGDAVVMFYAPWCGHCKTALPEIKAAAADMKKAGVKVGTIDSVANAEAATKYGVKGFPHTAYFSGGKPTAEHNAFPRTAESFVEFAKTKGASGAAVAAAAGAATTDAAPKEPADMAELEKIMSSPKAVVMFYAPWCGHCTKTKPQFGAATAAMKAACPGLEVALVNGDADAMKPALAKYDVPHFPLIRAFANGKKTADYKGDRSKATFVDFAKEQASS